jgi:malate dehydrogenase
MGLPMKVTVVGAGGNVGSAAALAIAQRDFAQEVVAIDLEVNRDGRTLNPARGRALDEWQTAPIHLFDTYLHGTTDYAATAGSDVCVITAGVPRRPGMSRDDLLGTNAGIVQSVAGQLARHSPDTVIIVVSNPLDAMAYVAYRASGLPPERVMGMAGILDTARYRAFLAQELNISPKDIQALILGGHGDTMVPLPRYTTVTGIPVTQLIAPERLQEIIRRTQFGGGEFVEIMGTSAWYAPGAAAAQMVEAVALDQNRILPCSAWVTGQYGLSDLFVGVPVKLGRGGIREILEVELDAEEQKLLEASAADVRSSFEALNRLLDL